MNYFTATFHALAATFRQALKPPTTVQYPRVVRAREPRLRGSFALTKDAAGDENCIGCKKCEKVCPSEVIALTTVKVPSPITGKKRGYASDFTLNLEGCIICELCVQVCPTDAIVMIREQEPPAYSREDLTLTMDKLYKNGEHPERFAWSNATLLGKHQDPERGAAVASAGASPAAPAEPDA